MTPTHPHPPIERDDFRVEYRPGDIIGHSQIAIVYAGTLTYRSDSRESKVAIKVLDKRAQDEDLDKGLRRGVAEREIRAYTMFDKNDGPPLQHLSRRITDQTNDTRMELVLERYGSSAWELSEEFGASGQRELMVVDFILSASAAMAELASLYIASRDAHPKNFVLRNDPQSAAEPYDFVAIDFGHSNVGTETNNTLRGMDAIQHPRLIKPGSQEKHAGLRDDLFAVGVSAWILATGGQTPWARPNGTFIQWDASGGGTKNWTYKGDLVALRNAGVTEKLATVIQELTDPDHDDKWWDKRITHLSDWQDLLRNLRTEFAEAILQAEGTETGPDWLQPDGPRPAEDDTRSPVPLREANGWPVLERPHGIRGLATIDDFHPKPWWRWELTIPRRRLLLRIVLEAVPVLILIASAALTAFFAAISAIPGSPDAPVLTATRAWWDVLNVALPIVFFTAAMWVLWNRFIASPETGRRLPGAAIKAAGASSAAAVAILVSATSTVWLIENGVRLFLPTLAWRFADWAPLTQGFAAVLMFLAITWLLFRFIPRSVGRGLAAASTTMQCMGLVALAVAVLSISAAGIVPNIGQNGLAQLTSLRGDTSDCGEDAVPLTKTSTSLCIPQNDEWEPLSGDELAASVFAANQGLAVEARPAGYGTLRATAALTSTKYACVTVFATVLASPPDNNIPQITTDTQVPTDQRRDMTALTEQGHPVRLNLAGTAFDVFTDLPRDDTALNGVIYYRASPTVFGEGLWADAGRNSAVEIYEVLDGCVLTDRDAIEDTVRAFVNSLVVNDRAYADTLAWAYDEVALRNIDLSVDDLLVPNIKGAPLSAAGSDWVAQDGKLASVPVWLSEDYENWVWIEFFSDAPDANDRPSKVFPAATNWSTTETTQYEDRDEGTKYEFWLTREFDTHGTTIYATAHVAAHSADLSQAQYDKLAELVNGIAVGGVPWFQ